MWQVASDTQSFMYLELQGSPGKAIVLGYGMIV